MYKLLFVIGSLQAGGAERVASRLCSYWADAKEFDVTLLTSDNEVNDFYSLSQDVTRESLNFNFGIDGLINIIFEQFTRFFKISKYLRSNKPDVIVLSTTEISIRFLASLLFFRKKIIICEHNNYFALRSKFKRLCRLVLYRRASYIFVLTERDRNVYVDQKGFNSQKVVVMPNPLGIENKTLLTDVHCNNNSLLAVGRLCEQKSFDRLIKAMAHIDPSYCLKIAGTGPLQRNLEDLIKKEGQEERIKLLGAVKNMNKLYEESTLLLMTSKFEGLPMVIGEANNFGLPVVSFDCPTGPAEMIEDYKNGVLVENGNIIDFANIVNQLLSSRSQLEKMRALSFEKSKAYMIDSIVSSWRKYLSSESP